MELCQFLTGKDARALGSVLNIGEAVHEGLRAGIAEGRFALVTFDGNVMHLVHASTVDPESSLCGLYDNDEIGHIEVLLVAGAGGAFDIELAYNDEPVVVELEY